MVHLIERAAERLRQAGTPPPAASPSIATELPRPGTALPGVTLERLVASGLVEEGKGRTRVSEEFRIAESRILRSMVAAQGAGEAAANLLMVTSSRPGEGKTFSALNLAGSFARFARRKVVLVDTDTKQHSLSHALGLTDRPGFLDLLNPAVEPSALLVPTAIPQLHLLPIGASPAGLADMQGANSLDAIVHRLEQSLPSHLIVLDTAPCLSTSDASALAHVVGQIVMVVQAEHTQRSELQAAIDLVRICPTILLLLNKAQAQTNYSFGAYYGIGGYE